MRLRDLRANARISSILSWSPPLWDYQGRVALNSLRGEWSPEVGRGDSKHPSLPLARAERKPLDQKEKPAPRHQRENQLKEKTSPASGPRGAQAI